MPDVGSEDWIALKRQVYPLDEGLTPSPEKGSQKDVHILGDDGGIPIVHLLQQFQADRVGAVGKLGFPCIHVIPNGYNIGVKANQPYEGMSLPELIVNEHGSLPDQRIASCVGCELPGELGEIMRMDN